MYLYAPDRTILENKVHAQATVKLRLTRGENVHFHIVTKLKDTGRV